MNKLLISAALVAISTGAIAEDYRFEVKADYLANEVNKNTDQTTYALGGAFYLSPVDDSNGPKAEAAFLNQASEIHLGYGATNIEIDGNSIDPGFGVKVDEDGDVWAVGGSYITGNGIILQLDYAVNDVDKVVDSEVSGVGIGYYLNDTSTVSLNYAYTEEDISGFEEDNWSLGYKNLFNNKFGLELDLSYSDPKNGEEAYGIVGDLDYYINDNFSVGGVLGYISSDNDFREAAVYGVKAEYFFNSMIALDAGYTVSTPEEGDDNNIWSVGLTARF